MKRGVASVPILVASIVRCASIVGCARTVAGDPRIAGATGAISAD